MNINRIKTQSKFIVSIKYGFSSFFFCGVLHNGKKKKSDAYIIFVIEKMIMF